MSEIKKPIEIYVESNQFTLKKDKYLININKITNEATNLDKFEPHSSPFYCYGIVGSFKADKQNYLIYIDEAIKKGEYLGAEVYLITKFNYIPYESDSISPEDYKYITMMNDFLGRNLLHFSDRIDLTMSYKYLQSILNEDLEKKWTNIFSLSNTKFCWNYQLAKMFIVSEHDDLDQFIFPIINGFFGTCSGEEYSGNLDLVLIARKDTRRSGMRFLIRGADKSGSVANFVEIEQILIDQHSENTIVNSFVQLRGSIPLIWTQEPNMTRNPKIRFQENSGENYEAFSTHINELINDYDSIHCINLIDKKKDQLKIGKEYEKLCNDYKAKETKNGKNLEYSWFDFHHECKKMRYYNIKKLFMQESVQKHLDKSRYTIIKIEQNNYLKMIKDKEGKILKYLLDENFLDFAEKQKVVFRTNCVDSLDRTNVVQSIFARYFLLLMLKDLSLSDVTPSKEDITTSFRGNFENKFKNLWADNGDNLSFTYSGTGAMKSDFVRTGKRTLLGNLRDGYLTTKRLYINNLMDGYNQDCHDYFLGNLNPKKDKLKSHSLLGVLIVHILAFIIELMMTNKIKEGGYGFIGFILWIVLSFVIILGTSYVLRNNFIDLHSNHK